jgi:hypothetical protein
MCITFRVPLPTIVLVPGACHHPAGVNRSPGATPGR